MQFSKNGEPRQAEIAMTNVDLTRQVLGEKGIIISWGSYYYAGPVCYTRVSYIVATDLTYSVPRSIMHHDQVSNFGDRYGAMRGCT